MFSSLVMATLGQAWRLVERVPVVVTGVSALASVVAAVDQNAVAAWSAVVFASGGVAANMLLSKYRELREVRRQQDSADREALVSSIRDRILAEIELANKVTQNSARLDEIKRGMEEWSAGVEKKILSVQAVLREYEDVVRRQIATCENCGKLILRVSEDK